MSLGVEQGCSADVGWVQLILLGSLVGFLSADGSAKECLSQVSLSWNNTAVPRHMFFISF